MNKDFKEPTPNVETARNEAVAARELVSKVIERVNDGFVALDGDWCYTYVNARAARMLQRENANELIGKHIWTEYPEGIGQPFYKAYLKAYETQQAVIFEEYYPPWDQWFENRIYPSPDGLTIYFTEITERKKAEQSIKRVNRALMVLSSCNEAQIRTSNEAELLEKVCSIITEVGHYPLVWIGLAEHDENRTVRPIAQKGFSAGYLNESSISWGDNENGCGSTGNAIRTGQPVIIQDMLNHPEAPWLQCTAQQYDVVASIALPINTSETVYGALNIYAKAANAFDAEEVRLLQDLADNLGFGIAALHTQIERQQLQRQLQQAQKMEAIGQLTGGIAHDFNNIIGCIMGYTSLALERYASDSETKLADYLNEVYRAGERARDLIRQMLAFSQKSATNSHPISLEPSIKEAIQLLQSTLPSSICLQSEIGANVSKVMMDPIHLHQLVMNLCINARDALEGEGKIDVLLGQVSNIDGMCDSCHEQVKGDFVELVVKDTGSGLDPMAFDRIFDPFYTTKEAGKGTGMGLSIVHGIVHEHGGHILIESSTGNGSNFRLLFPAVIAETEVTDAEEAGFSNASQRAGGEHLLIVDDEEPMAMFLTELLDLSGYQVTMMTDSTQALSLFEQNPQNFDLVITDQTMPGMNGGELATKMLRIRSNIPIILCTGHSEKVDSERAEELGIKRFLQKPFNHKVLLDSVSELLHL